MSFADSPLHRFSASSAPCPIPRLLTVVYTLGVDAPLTNSSLLATRYSPPFW